jgi:DNA polymerase elongation subunit (family B)
MKLEKICSQAFFGMKKRYALNVDWDEGIWYKEPKLKVTGFEPVRSPIPKVCREAMLVIYKMIFKHDQQGIYDYIDEFKKKFYKMSFDQIGTATSCNGITKWSHPITLYKLHAPIHVKGAIFYNNILKKKGLDNQYEMIYDGDKVKYCYLIKDNPTRQEILSVKGDTPKEFELEQYIDYNHMWDKNFMKPMQTVLDIVGMQSKEIGDIYSIFS